jgi:hypothetical protein
MDATEEGREMSVWKGGPSVGLRPHHHLECWTSKSCLAGGWWLYNLVVQMLLHTVGKPEETLDLNTCPRAPDTEK